MKSVVVAFVSFTQSLRKDIFRGKRSRNGKFAAIATALAVMLSALGLAASPALASSPKVLFVNGDGGDDNRSCTTIEAPCETIQGAVDRASDGDTINVAAGTYTDSLSIGKALTLLGANAGKTGYASDRGSAESLITTTSAATTVTITASNVVLDGFEVGNDVTGQNWITGVAIGGSSNPANVVLRNNKIREIGSKSTTGTFDFAGVLVYESDGTRIEGNYIYGLNCVKCRNIGGINTYADDGQKVENLTIHANKFENILNTGSGSGNTDANALVAVAGTRAGTMTFTSNEVVGTKIGFNINPDVAPDSTFTIKGNAFSKIIFAGIYLLKAPGVAIQNNTFSELPIPDPGSRTRGASVIVDGAVGSGSVTLARNSFSANAIAIDSNADNVDAAGNSWGSPQGPSNFPDSIVGPKKALVQQSTWISVFTPGPPDPGFQAGVGFWPIITQAEASAPTPTGANVEDTFVGLPNGGQIALKFDQVDDTGTTTVVAYNPSDPASFPEPPSGFSLGTSPVYYTITTTATFTDSFELCLSYDSAALTRPTVYHFTGGQWNARPTSYKDGPPAQACATLTGFSQFALGVPIPPPPPPVPTFPPSAPRDVVGVPGDREVGLSWTAPADAGSFPVSTYQAVVSPGGQSCLVAVPALTCTVTGLTNGTAYTATVRALNGAGWGPNSAASSVITPGVVPEAPTGVVAVPGNAEAIVGWVAPASTGGSAVTGYRIEQKLNDGDWMVAIADTGATTTNAVVAGLTNGQSYRFRVAAINAVGVGANSEPSNEVSPEVPAAVSILIVGERAQVRGRSGIVVTGESTGFAEGTIFRPWFRFPGQTSYTQGNATLRVDAAGEFRWQRQTGKKVYVSVRAGDGTRSNRVIIPAN